MSALTSPGSQSVTMTSLELVDYINSQRADGEAVLAHSDFLKKVLSVLGEAVAGNFSGYYKASNGKQNPMYIFPKREACLMAMSYSYDLQAKVFDRMTALEQATTVSAFAIPQTYTEALRLAADMAEKKDAAEKQLAIAAPKVEFADALLNAEGTTLVRDVAKNMGVRVRKLEKALRTKGVILPNNAPAAVYVSKGYFKEATHSFETKTKGTQIGHTTRVTGRGIEFIRRFVSRHAELVGSIQ